MSKAKLMLGGLKSFLPRRQSYTMSSHPVDVRYGYAVWLRHLVSLARCGVNGPFPVVVELGPGNSVATGICAILAGSDRYIGLDVLRHLELTQGERAFAELESMFRACAAIPDETVYPALRPRLVSYDFPRWLNGGNAPGTRSATVTALMRDLEALARGQAGGDTLRYIVPWDATALPEASVDLVMSQAVLQEIPNRSGDGGLRATIAATARWLRPGGYASHQVDLGMYGMTPWNIHWSWSDLTWRIVRGRRDNFVNREPLSTYRALFRECGFSVVAIHAEEADGIDASLLATRFRSLPENERRIRTAHVVVRKAG